MKLFSYVLGRRGREGERAMAGIPMLVCDWPIKIIIISPIAEVRAGLESCGQWHHMAYFYHTEMPMLELSGVPVLE